MKEKLPIYSKSISNLLKRELAKRQSKNSAYSIRAFARDLNSSVSSLHDYMNLKKSPSVNKIRSLCESLKLSEEEILEFTTLVKDIDQAKGLLGDIPHGNDELQADLDIIHGDVYHLAYLGLDNLIDFENTADWISKKLSISKDLVCEIEERLCRVGMLILDENGHYTKPDNRRKLTTKRAKRDIARTKSLYKQSFELTSKALDECEEDQVAHSMMIFPIDSVRVPEAKKLIQDFRRELASSMTQSENPNELYGLTITLNPLTKTVR